MATRALVTGTDYLLGYVEDRTAVLSFNRPERRNALHEEIYDGFARALPVVASDPTIGCLVVTGEGGAFCAGGDVKGFAAAHREQAAGTAARPSPERRIDELRVLQQKVSLALHRLPKITIAALPGAAAGAGLSIALACDLRVATESAVLATAFAKIGASGDFGGSYFLTQLVGPAKAKELYLLSDRISAQDALALGIVNRVFPDAHFDEGWRAFAARVAGGAPLANRAIKENINRALVSDLAACLDAEAANMVATMSTEDHREASAAFVEERAAVFVGR